MHCIWWVLLFAGYAALKPDLGLGELGVPLGPIFKRTRVFKLVFLNLIL